MPLISVRKCSAKDLEAVTELAERHTSFDTTPSVLDIDGMRARNSEYFFVAEDDQARVVGFITGCERKGMPEEVLRAWSARKIGYVELMAWPPCFEEWA